MSDIVNALSPVSEFQAHLIQEGKLSGHQYVKDFNYRDHGFEFIETQSDIDLFLSKLDSAKTWHSNGTGACSKAGSIRFKLSQPNTCDFDMQTRFRIAAASARRVNCGCHETGSYFPKY